MIIVIGENVAPKGLVTCKLVALAKVTVAFVAPKYTTLFAGVLLKFVPVIVTVVPALPLAGEKLVILGTCEKPFTATKNKNAVKNKKG